MHNLCNTTAHNTTIVTATPLYTAFFAPYLPPFLTPHRVLDFRIGTSQRRKSPLNTGAARQTSVAKAMHRCYGCGSSLVSKRAPSGSAEPWRCLTLHRALPGTVEFRTGASTPQTTPLDVLSCKASLANAMHRCYGCGSSLVSKRAAAAS